MAPEVNGCNEGFEQDCLVRPLIVSGCVFLAAPLRGRFIKERLSKGRPSSFGLSGSSGKSCRPRQQGDSGRAARPVSAALAPDKGMAMCIPVDSGAVDRIGDLVPGLKPPAR